MRYFASFPTITYANTNVVDITRRVKVVDKSKKSPYAFYPYDITNHLRGDQVAEFYYDNAYLDWLIYISNEIVDPYYDWYVRDDQLDELIRTKYGSTETSKRKIKYFMNNWFEHADDQISTSYYENTIDQNLKKYYDPYWSENGKILYYVRRRIDHTHNTNKLIDYDITYVSGNSFTSGELVDIWYTANSLGTGEVVFSNSSSLRIKSVQGNTFANSTTNTFIVGETSSTNATASLSNTMIENITDEENVYWTPVYYYDFEVMKNEANRTINLVDNQIVPFLLTEFVKKIANT